jgi:hypothetical protein
MPLVTRTILVFTSTCATLPWPKMISRLSGIISLAAMYIAHT